MKKRLYVGMVLGMVWLSPLQGMALSCMPMTPENVSVLFKGTVTDVTSITPKDPRDPEGFSHDKVTVRFIEAVEGKRPPGLPNMHPENADVTLFINNYDPWGGPYIEVGQTRWFGGRYDEKEQKIYLGACELFQLFEELDKS